jgi:hypothetical protein
MAASRSVPFSLEEHRDALFPFTHIFTKMPPEVVPLLGVEAHGNVDPPDVFVGHCLVKLNGLIYDPSYGTGPFPAGEAGEIEWEDASVAGFRKLFVIDGRGYLVAKANDPGGADNKEVVFEGVQ